MNDSLLINCKRDAITNLPYFDDFCQVCDGLIEMAKKEYYIVAFDISNFKLINDNYGFAAGDVLLNEAIRVFCLEDEECLVATRIYSDHIMAMYARINDKETIPLKVTRLNDIFVKRNQIKYSMVTLHIHAGIYKLEKKDEHITDCVDKANIARKAAKGHYKIDCVEYNDSLLYQQMMIADTITTLEENIRNNQVMIMLQPKVDIDTKTIIGAEALSRLVDKDGNMIAPDVFIPILEKTGKIVDLDRYVLKSIIKLVYKWKRLGIKNLRVSVNMSRVHFYMDDLAESIIENFEELDLSPEYIEFEVTESVFLDNTDMVIEKIEKLRNYGFKISIDDFGSGYSSLNLMSILPVDIVKLDKGFIDNSLNTKRGQEIIKGLIKLLNNIDLDIICEGIETEEEEKLIREFGCHQVQGFLYDKPIKIEEFEKKYVGEEILSRIKIKN